MQRGHKRVDKRRVRRNTTYSDQKMLERAIAEVNRLAGQKFHGNLTIIFVNGRPERFKREEKGKFTT